MQISPSGQYRGRFAPSPTGPLHFGSLIAALASFLDARAAQGQWLVRIEDLDPPREQPGAASQILKTLESFELFWDEEVVYQSLRHQAYVGAINEMRAQQQTYLCRCSRKTVLADGGLYNNRCRNKDWPWAFAGAIRVKQPEIITFTDRLQGRGQPLEFATEDFVIRRRDGLFAYQLAVVVDDIEQAISHIVRGADLIDSTPKQLRLYQLLQAQPPTYLHLPLVLNKEGQKLSKQNFAPGLDTGIKLQSLYQALIFLGQKPPPELLQGEVCALLNWASRHWRPDLIPTDNRQCELNYSHL